jgi:hypothetical protein
VKAVVNLTLDVDDEAFLGDVEESLEETIRSLLFDLTDVELKKISIVIR